MTREIPGSKDPDVKVEHDYENLVGELLDKHVSPVVGDFMNELMDRHSNKSRAEEVFTDGEQLQNIIMETVQAFIDVIERHFPTPESLRGLMERGDVDLVFLRDDVSCRVQKALDREEEMLEAGYDSLMEGFISLKSKVGEQVLNRVTENLIRRSIERERPMAMIFLDLDNFKGVNTYGQLVGDIVLKHVASMIKEEIRNGICVRLGGEEIAVILEDISEDDAARVALRLNKKLQTNPAHLIAEAPNLEEQHVMNATQIASDRFMQLARRTGEITLGKRALEKVILDPRGRNGHTHIKLLEVPLSASMGVVEINPAHEDPLKDAIERANQQETLAKENGRAQVWAKGERVPQIPENDDFRLILDYKAH